MSTDPATTKQLNFFNALLTERGYPAVDGFREGTTRREASAAIDNAKTLPRTEQADGKAHRQENDTVTATEPGVYEKDGEVFIVKPNREKTRVYAKRLIEINAERATESGERVQVEFEYAPGAIYNLAPADKMPLDRAKELTIRYGRCIVCGRHLKAADSVERGIGPVCIKNFA